MWTETDQKRTAVEHVRMLAKELVRREAYRVGSKSIAYQNVGSDIGGVSGYWIKKFVRGYAEAGEPTLSVAVGIIAAYSRICERLETHTKLIEGRNEAMARALGLGERENNGVAADAETQRAA